MLFSFRRERRDIRNGNFVRRPAHGLPVDIATMADQRVRIEMPGRAESLDVAAAAAICLYESARARRQPRVP